MGKPYVFTCSCCFGRVESTARADRINGRPVCGSCLWAPAQVSPPVVARPKVATLTDMDPDERRVFAFGRRSA
jgi:hypothetical protein